jgi:hypothetical protein
MRRGPRPARTIKVSIRRRPGVAGLRRDKPPRGTSPRPAAEKETTMEGAANNNASRPKPLFSRTLRSGAKLFFIDVYEGRIGVPYLSICENRKDKDGNFTRIRLFLNREAVPEMRDALDEVHEFFESHVPAGAPARGGGEEA